MINLTKDQVLHYFNENKDFHRKYQKKGKFLYRYADPGETILTIVDGKLETMKTVGELEVVLMNIELGSSCEQYIISLSTFLKRYVIYKEEILIGGHTWKRAVASGRVIAFENTLEEPFMFMAPWGEEMICNQGDYLANPVGGEPTDVYRIEKNTFLQTYGEPIN